MGVGQLLALALPARFAAAYAVCFVLSILYSVPPFRLKAVAGADWLINMWGFGTLTPYAGWATTGLPLDSSHAMVLLAFCPLFAALYPLTQLYQMEEDSRRGDRTFALVLGGRRSLNLAIAAVVLAFALFFAAAPKDRLTLALLGGALVAWLAVLLPWRRSWSRMTSRQHQHGMYLALAAWAATDLAVLLAWG
jgi:4-hydroxybenzoate polyprenyltransferase